MKSEHTILVAPTRPLHDTDAVTHRRTPPTVKLGEQLQTPYVHPRLDYQQHVEPLPSALDMAVAAAVGARDPTQTADDAQVAAAVMPQATQNQLASVRNGIYEAHCFRSSISTIMMVIDVEALVLGSIGKYIVEQVAYVVVDGYGKEMTSCKCIIYQPLNAHELVSAIGCSFDDVSTAIYHYKRITRDASYIHADISFPDWDTMKDIITFTQRRFNATVYAKGAKMESQLFHDSFHVHELAAYGCPKYPHQVHDPLSECFFFAQYLPYKHLQSQSLSSGQMPLHHNQQPWYQHAPPPPPLPPPHVPCDTEQASRWTPLSAATQPPVPAQHVTQPQPQPPPQSQRPSYADVVSRPVVSSDVGTAVPSPSMVTPAMVQMDPKTIAFMPRQRKQPPALVVQPQATSLPHIRGAVRNDGALSHAVTGNVGSIGCGAYNRVSTVSGGVLQSTTFYMWYT